MQYGLSEARLARRLGRGRVETGTKLQQCGGRTGALAIPTHIALNGDASRMRKQPAVHKDEEVLVTPVGPVALVEERQLGPEPLPEPGADGDPAGVPEQF